VLPCCYRVAAAAGAMYSTVSHLFVCRRYDTSYSCEQRDEESAGLLSFGRVSTQQCVAGGYGTSGKLFGAVEGLRKAEAIPPMGVSTFVDGSEGLVAVRTTMAEAPVAAAWAEGRAMTREQVIE